MALKNYHKIRVNNRTQKEEKEKEMIGTNLLDGFELIEIKASSRGRGSGVIKISNNKRMMSIPVKYSKELNWKDGERVNLKIKGTTFALEPSKVGLVTTHSHSGSGVVISNVNFCREVLSRTRSCREYDGWVEEGTLFFRPKRGDE